MSNHQLFEELKAEFTSQDGVEPGTMMGFPCLRIHQEFFASAHHESGNLIIKLPAQRVNALIEEGIGNEFSPNGRRFKEWVEIPSRDKAQWQALTHEAMTFVTTASASKKSKSKKGASKADAEPLFISDKLFSFLEDLAQNNDKEWFQANKKRYEQDVKDPFLATIARLSEGFATISPNVVVDPHGSRGSMQRINRDTRFSKDKTPYKTSMAAFFYLKGTKKSDHPAGYYLHLGLDQCFAGAGVWRPQAPSLQKIRQAMVNQPHMWQAVVDAPFDLGGESYKKPPKGFDPDHPFIEDLKRKDFVASVELKPEEVIGDGFTDRYLAACQQLKPLMDFLEGCLLES